MAGEEVGRGEEGIGWEHFAVALPAYSQMLE